MTNSDLAIDFLNMRELLKPIVDGLKCVDLTKIDDPVLRYRVELARQFDDQSQTLTRLLARLDRIRDEMERMRVKTALKRRRKELPKSLIAARDELQGRALRLIGEFEAAERDLIAVGNKLIGADLAVTPRSIATH